MLILALDSSGAACSVAVGRDGALLAERAAPLERGHGEILLPMVVAVMAEAGVGFAELDRVAVAVGPGGFTGVRIGLAAARAIGLAANVPVVGVPSFEAVAAAVPEAERQGRTLLVAIESKRAELFLQVFGANAMPVGDPAVRTPEDAVLWAPREPLLLAGDGAGRLASAFPAERVALATVRLVHARALLGLAAAREPGARPPSALYLRPPEAKSPRTLAGGAPRR